MKVFYTDYNYQNKEIEKKLFEEAGIEVVFADKTLPRKELIEFCKEADGLVTTYTVVDEEFLRACPHLKIAVRSGIGYNTIDVDACTKHGVMVANVRNYCVDEVSDHALALTLSLIRKLPLFDYRVKKDHSWTVNDGRPIKRISEMAVGCYGLGAIGKEYARKVKALGMSVFAYDPYLADSEWKNLGINKVDSIEALADCDVVSIHTPLTDKTKNSIGLEFFSKMKPTAYLINVSRGEIVNEEELTNALAGKQLAGAGLDVLSSEHPDLSSPLVQMQNVIITPHVAYYSDGSERSLQELSAKQAILALTKGAPEFFVNRKELGR